MKGRKKEKNEIERGWKMKINVIIIKIGIKKNKNDKIIIMMTYWKRIKTKCCKK